MKGWIDEKKMILRGGACRRSGVGECMRVRRPLCPLFISTGLGQFRGLRNEFQDVLHTILVYHWCKVVMNGTSGRNSGSVGRGASGRLRVNPVQQSSSFFLPVALIVQRRDRLLHSVHAPSYRRTYYVLFLTTSKGRARKSLWRSMENGKRTLLCRLQSKFLVVHTSRNYCLANRLPYGNNTARSCVLWH